MDCLFVRDTHRGGGVGRILMKAALEHTRLHGTTELQWQTPTWNSGAIRFYDRLGAAQQTKRRFTLTVPND